MQFIEFLFRLSPDGGTGVAEIVFLVAPVITALAIVLRVVRH